MKFASLLFTILLYPKSAEWLFALPVSVHRYRSPAQHSEQLGSLSSIEGHRATFGRDLGWASGTCLTGLEVTRGSSVT